MAGITPRTRRGSPRPRQLRRVERPAQDNVTKLNPLIIDFGGMVPHGDLVKTHHWE